MPFVTDITSLPDQMANQYNNRMYKNFNSEDLLWVLGSTVYGFIMEAAAHHFAVRSKPTHYMGIKVTKCEGIESNEFHLSIIKP